MAQLSDRHESAPRPSRRGWSPLQYLVRYGEPLKVTSYTRRTLRKERQARSSPLRALSRKEKGQYLMYGPPVESQDDEISPWPSPLCPTMGARGLFILLEVREDVLNVDTAPPRQRRTRWLAGSASVERLKTWNTTRINKSLSGSIYRRNEDTVAYNCLQNNRKQKFRGHIQTRTYPCVQTCKHTQQ